MYMNDAKDILGIEGDKDAPTTSKKPKVKKEKAPKKSGGKKNTVDYVKQLLPGNMGINVHDLVNQIGDSQQNHLQMSFKKFGKKPVRKWVWGDFTNSARDDDLVLNHWKRVGAKPTDYPFAVLNKKEPMPVYTDAEYKVLMDASEVGESDWSKEETDYLIKLVDEYHLIWTVIHDRYDFPNGPKRSLDDLKARFHLIDDAVKFLHGYQGPASDYNYEAEVKRKYQLKNFIFRTQEQLEEEEYIVKELERIRKRDREFLIAKRQAKIEKLAKIVASKRIVKRAILTARRTAAGNKPNPTSPRRLLSPRMDLAIPGGLDFDTIVNFGLTSKPVKKLAVSDSSAAAFFASEAADVSFGQHVSKQPLIQAVYNYYVPLTSNPKIFTEESAENSIAFRSRIHCISELKGTFTSLVSEYARLQELEKAAGLTPEPLAPEHTVRHFMKDRVSEDGKQTYESLFHIVPPTFPVANCIKLNNNGLPIRNTSATISYPKDLARTRRSSTGPIASERLRLSPPPPTPPKAVSTVTKPRPSRDSTTPSAKKTTTPKTVVRASDIGAPPMTVVSPRSDGRPARSSRPKQFFSPKK